MAELSSGMTKRPLSVIFSWLEKHDLALPELQRPSVWGNHKTPRLLSSVYHDYPFGIFLIWTPKEDERIRCKPFVFQRDREFDAQRLARHYLVDGQQRLTSFYRSLHRDGDLEVVFNIRTQEFALPDAKIRAMLKNPREYGWYPLKRLLRFKTVEIADMIKSHADLPDGHLEAVIGTQGKIQHLLPERVEISFYNIQEKSYGDVSEIFERINLGTPVKKSQILLGRLSTVYPGVVGKVEEYLENVRKRHGCRFDLDLFISSFSTVATEYPHVDKLESEYLQNAEPNGIGRDLRKTERALEKALTFIRQYLFIDTMKYFPSERTLTCLGFLFIKRPDYMAHEANCHRIALWTAWAALVGHHDNQRRLARDIGIIRDSEDNDIAEELIKHLKSEHDIGVELRWHFSALSDMDCPISRNNLLFDFLYALVRWKGAVSFLSRVPVETKVVDETGDDEEEESECGGNPEAIHEHHIYPVARLKEESSEDEFAWITREWIHDIANITFLTGQDNQELQDPDIEYLAGVPAEIKAGHLIDSCHYRQGQYEKFLENRRKLIKKALGEYLEELETKAGYPW